MACLVFLALDDSEHEAKGLCDNEILLLPLAMILLLWPLFILCVLRKASGTEGMKLVLGHSSRTCQRNVTFRFQLHNLIHDNNKSLPARKYWLWYCGTCRSFVRFFFFNLFVFVRKNPRLYYKKEMVQNQCLASFSRILNTYVFLF